ncbi:MAG: glycosyltransferase family 4 protein [Chloroflexi bacterium]|nr:glycosyltransferase family 4 protein [Chloroflexota bacterium]
MFIGLVIYGRLDAISGGYLYDRRLVDYLRSQGDVVEVVSLPWRGYGRHLLQNFSPTLRRRLSRANYDLLLQDELNHPSLFWLNRRLRARVSYPIVSIVHHLRSSERHPAALMSLYRQVERRYLRSVDGFIFNSKTTRTAVYEINHRGAEEAEATSLKKSSALSASPRCKEIPHVVALPAGDRWGTAVSENHIRRRAGQPGPLRLLFVGNLIPRKGLDGLLTAVAALPPDCCRLDVVGDTAVNPAYTRRIRRQITQLGLANRVTLHNVLQDNALKEKMLSSHLLVVPSQYEGFGIVYLEGMGFGLPAIGGQAGGAREIIQDGVNGWLVDVGDTAVLSQHIRHLHQDRAHLIEMSLAARQHFLTQPTWQESMAKIRRFLKEIAICYNAHKK